MPDEEVESVEAEAVAQAPESEQADQPDQKPADTQQDLQDRKRKDLDYNWAEARRKMEHLERKAKEQEELIASLSRAQQPAEEDFSNLSDDDIITVKQHKSMAAKIARQVAEEVVKQREAATVDERISAKYPDFKDVVTPESIELLKQNDPELALSLYRLADDPYAQNVAAYKLLKKSGYGASEMKKQDASQDKKKAQVNSSKPVSVNAVTKQSAIGNVHAFENGLTPELKSQLWKEMQQAIKGY
jgi:hypothetical protein